MNIPSIKYEFAELGSHGLCVDRLRPICIRSRNHMQFTQRVRHARDNRKHIRIRRKQFHDIQHYRCGCIIFYFIRLFQYQHPRANLFFTTTYNSADNLKSPDTSLFQTHARHLSLSQEVGVMWWHLLGWYMMPWNVVWKGYCFWWDLMGWEGDTGEGETEKVRKTSWKWEPNPKQG